MCLFERHTIGGSLTYFPRVDLVFEQIQHYVVKPVLVTWVATKFSTDIYCVSPSTLFYEQIYLKLIAFPSVLSVSSFSLAAVADTPRQHQR